MSAGQGMDYSFPIDLRKTVDTYAVDWAISWAGLGSSLAVAIDGRVLSRTLGRR